MPNYTGKTWKSINLNASRANRGAYAGGGMAVEQNSINWYNRIMSNPTKRKEVVHRYLMMDQTLDISRALDIMAEDISGTSIEATDTFQIKYTEDSNLKKSTIETVEKAKKLWKERTGFDVNFYSNIREMLLYGAVFFKIEADFTLTKLVQTRIEGYVLEHDDDTRVAAYLYNNAAIFTNEEGDQVGPAASKTVEYESIPLSSLLILKIGEGPFGTSVLERSYRTWRHIQLIEDAVIVYRIMRAPERRIFYIDVGRQSGPRAEAYIERVKLKMRQRQVQRNEMLDSDYKPQSQYEDFFIATTSEGRSSKIDTLPGGSNLDQIKDLIYFNKKLAMGLRIPVSYMQSYYSDDAPTTATDGRVGTAYMEELRYAAYILRIQTNLNKHIFENFKLYCKHIGVVLPVDEMIFEIAPPQSFALYRENDLYSTLFNTVVSATSFDFISKKFILQKFLHLEKQEMERNEWMVLSQKGYTKAQIKQLTEDQIDNVVYGDGQVQFDMNEMTPVRPITNELEADPNDPTAPNSAGVAQPKQSGSTQPKQSAAATAKKNDDEPAKGDEKPINKKNTGAKNNGK